LSERSINILRDLVAFETVSDRSNLELLDYLDAELKKVGFDTVRAAHDHDRDTHANLIAALFPPHITAPPDRAFGLMLSGHTDVVPVNEQNWVTNPFKMVEQEGRLIGRGTADMKGFIAGIVAHLDRMAKGRLRQPLYLNFTYKEEPGCLGVDAAIQEFPRLGIDPEDTIVGEPTLFNVVRGTMATARIQVRFKGTGGHSSDVDEEDVLGVDELIRRFQTRIREIQYREIQQKLGDNYVGKAHVAVTGQTAIPITTNIAPEGETFTWFNCRTGIDVGEPAIRIVFEDVRDEVLRDFRGQGKTANMEIDIVSINLGNRGYFCADEDAVNFAAQLAQTLPEETVQRLIARFGAESSNYSRAIREMPHGRRRVTVVGPGSIKQAHKNGEFIEISQMDRMDRFMAKVIDHCHM